MFEKASRLKLRFETSRGLLSAEDLWDLPLTSGVGKPNLDDIAKSLHHSLREGAETQSFVTPAASTQDETLQLAFDVVKRIIDVRVAERDKAASDTKRREEKQKLFALIAEKKDDVLKGKSLEDLEKLAAEM